MMTCDLIDAELALGNLDEALRIGYALLEQERKRRHGLLDWAWGHYARCLAQQGDADQLRDALVQLFEQCRRKEWDRFGTFVDVYAALALRERRLDTAVRLIGYRDRALHSHGFVLAPRRDLDRDRAKAMAALEAEAVCALTLEEPGEAAESSRQPDARRG